jgi:hypothetical protein
MKLTYPSRFQLLPRNLLRDLVDFVLGEYLPKCVNISVKSSVIENDSHDKSPDIT